MADEKLQFMLEPAAVYYGRQGHLNKYRPQGSRRKSLSSSDPSSISLNGRVRRLSIDETTTSPSREFLVSVKHIRDQLLAQEDTDHNGQITIEDKGPKTFSLPTVSSTGLRSAFIQGNYRLGTLIQEVTLAEDYGPSTVTIDESRLTEDPLNRLSRFIKDSFWDHLTKRIDASVVEKVGIDPKDWTGNPRSRIYIPRTAPEQYDYYVRAAEQRPEINLDVQYLPADLSPDNIRQLNDKPGLLAIAMESYVTDEATGKRDLRGLPFVVPGGRFNELFGWDSYFESLGLLASGRIDLAKVMVEHFCFCIQHYGMILNANRSYFLSRSQPPFLTNMALNVYEKIKGTLGAEEFLRKAMLAAIKEYRTIWAAEPRLDSKTGLSRYRPTPLGIPQETEPDHFEHVLRPYCKKHGLSLADFIDAYNEKKIVEPDLDSYFLHDCAVRESGHDTSYRLEGVCADLATIDLNSLLYKFETDIANCLREHFNGALEVPAEYCAGSMVPNGVERSEDWASAAESRLAAVNTYLWNEEQGLYVDFNTVSGKQTLHPAAPTFWPLWAGMASKEQAESLVRRALPRFEVIGGVTSGTPECRAANQPPRQWDYPSGWAPHQILLWHGLLRYGYKKDAQRLAYKWLYIMTKAFADYNGVVVEKYDVMNQKAPQRVNAEYGNQGLDFRGMNREGFGWVNASYVCGLEVVDESMKRAIGVLAPWKTYEKQVLGGA